MHEHLTNEFSIRQLQIYSALCLQRFCSKFAINHAAIEELFQHLVSIGTAENLSEWEQSGGRLRLAGRGDPIPMDIVSVVPSDVLGLFRVLIESCVEVGLVDMYGMPTEKPKCFAERCLEILDCVSVTAPSRDPIVRYFQGSDAWGEAVSQKELDDLLARYN